jgi:uroporphyrin-III C-methyltransferase
MSVSLVGAGPGDPGLITVRGLERVRACEVFVYDRLVAPELVAEAPASALRIARDGRTQEAVNALLVSHGSQGRTVVRLKGGDPFVFGRGGEEALALASAGVPFEIVPGVSSLGAVPAAAGIPVTHRGVSGSVTAVAAHDPSRLDFAALARVGGTLVFFMGLAHVRALADGLAGHGLDPATPAAVVASGTTEAQQVVTAPLEGIAVAAACLESPALLVVGEAVSLADRLRPLRPAAPAVRRRRPRSRRAAAAPRPAQASSARPR